MKRAAAFLLVVALLLCLCGGSVFDPLIEAERPWSKAKTRSSLTPCPPLLTSVPIAAGAIDFSGADSILSTSFSAGGVVWGVSSFGRTIHSNTFGFADVASGRRFDGNTTISRIGSVTKVLTALGGLQAFEDGLIHLDDPLTKYAPAFAGVINPFEDMCSTRRLDGVTFRSLLSQMSGLQRELPLGNLDPKITTQAALASLNNTALIVAPWTRPSYSNLAYALVGRTLEPLWNRSYEEQIMHRVIKPLSMVRSGFLYDASVISSMATPYSPQGQALDPKSDMLTWTAPAGQAYSTMQDMLALGDELANVNTEGGILSASHKNMMLQSVAHLNEDDVSAFGMPWEIQLISAANGTTLVVPTKGGNVGGYSSLLAIFPTMRISIAIMWNSPVDEGTIGRQVLQAIAPALYKYMLKMQQPFTPVPQVFPLDIFSAPFSTPLAPGVKYTLSMDPQSRIVSIANNIQPNVGQPLNFALRIGDQWLLQLPMAATLAVKPMGCQGQMETALEGQYLYFQQQANGKWSFTIPGYLTNQVILTQ